MSVRTKSSRWFRATNKAATRSVALTTTQMTPYEGRGPY